MDACALPDSHARRHRRAGTTQQIRWTTVVVDDVTIRVSTDGGGSWQVISGSVDHLMPGWMDFSWTVPDTPSAEVLITVAEYFDPTLSDTSDAVFEIRRPTVTTYDPSPDQNANVVLVGQPACSGAGAGGLGLLAVLLLVRRRRR